MKRLLMLTLAASLASGCVSRSTASDASPVMPVASQSQCGLTAPGLVVARSAGEWRHLAGAMATSLPAWPDDDDRWLLVAALGRQNTAGYGVVFDHASLAGEELTVHVSVQQPASGAMLAQMVTTPCLVLSIPADGWQRLTVSGESPFPLSRRHP